jgi:effector-binding domain-containing protein
MRVLSMPDQEIDIKKVPAIKVASLMAKGLPFQETVPKAFGDLMRWMISKGLPMPASFPMGLVVYYSDPMNMHPREVMFKVAMPISNDINIISEGNFSVEELAKHKVAYITIRGSYEDLDDAYGQLAEWVEKNNYRFADAPREVYVEWGEHIPPEEWVTEIQFPVERRIKHRYVSRSSRLALATSHL